MENKLQIFNNPEFGQIRTLEIDGEPWFVGRDIAEVLGYSDTKSALADHVDAEDKQIIQRGQIATLEVPNRGLTIINESGLYSLVLCSKLPSAKKFKRWITSEVLPALRKTGSYQARPMTPAEQLLENAKIMVEHERRISLVEKKYDCIGNSIYELSKPTPSGDTWQSDTLHQIRQLCAENNLNYQQFITDLYKELEESAGVNLETRRKNKRNRLELQGAKYAEIQKVSKLSIVSEDKKLREILSNLVRNHAAALVVAKMPTA